MSHRLTLICDACGKEFLIDEVMDVPPYWLAVQLAVGDSEGFVPDHEQNNFLHFCDQSCFIEFAKSDNVKERILMVDKDNGIDEQDFGESGSD